MTIDRVKRAAHARGMHFDGQKRFRNSTVGYAYEVIAPNGIDYMQADTLEGIYQYVMRFSKVRDLAYTRQTSVWKCFYGGD